MDKPIDAVIIENRRLVKEVRQLRARLAAFESSRWWRLHPRFALRGLRRFVVSSQSDDLDQQISASPQPTVSSNERATRFRDEVVVRGTFNHDWFTEHIPTWEPVLEKLEGRQARILEVGSFEGLSACFLLWRLTDARVTCVDTFAGSAEQPALGVAISDLEDVFERNVALVDSARVRKVVGESGRVLTELIENRERFDLIYVDASHLALDVVVDASLAWQLLRGGGVIIFDDYRWTSPLGEDPFFRPGPAIDAFLSLVGSHCEILVKGRQLIARKTDRSEGSRL